MAGPVAKPLHPPYFNAFTQLIENYKYQRQLIIILGLEETKHYQCIRCGEGCVSDWQVPVSQSHYQKWQKFWAKSQNPEWREPFLLRENPDENSFAYLRKQADGKTCIFFEGPATCLIHKTYGPEAKPQSCQAYPQMLKLSPQGYASEYLLSSCSQAPNLMLQAPQITYRLMQWQPNAPITLPSAGQLPLPVFYLWLGLVLDALEKNQSQPLQAFARLDFVLESFSYHSLYRFQVADLFTLYTAYFELPPRTEYPAPAALAWLESLEQQFFPELNHDLGPIQALSPQEQSYLNHYLWLYLRKSILTQAYQDPFRGQLSLFQDCFLIALFTRQIQRLALYFRQAQATPLNFHQLGRATNLMARRLLQNKSWFHQGGFDRWRPSEYIHAFRQILYSLLL